MAEPTGELLIGGCAVAGGGGLLTAIDPSTGARLEPSFRAGNPLGLTRRVNGRIEQG